jgi:hypothetical protein
MAIGEIEAYIRQAAASRGIDPEVAVRVARSEGGLDNPTGQSNVIKNGAREESYGPFQLLMDGGLGAAALQHGIDPRDPNQWKAGVDFALNYAAKNGWGSWYGARAVGVDNMEGIGRNATPRGISLNSNPVPTSQPFQPTDPAPETPPPKTGLASLFDDGSGLSTIAKAFGAGQTNEPDPKLNEITPSNLSVNRGTGSSTYQTAAQLMAQLLAKRRATRGLSLTG